MRRKISKDKIEMKKKMKLLNCFEFNTAESQNKYFISGKYDERNPIHYDQFCVEHKFFQSH